MLSDDRQTTETTIGFSGPFGFSERDHTAAQLGQQLRSWLGVYNDYDSKNKAYIAIGRS